MFPAEEAALKAVKAAAFLVAPAVLADIHETMRGLAAREQLGQHPASRDVEKEGKRSLTREDESNEVVADEETSLVGLVVRESIENGNTDDDGNHGKAKDPRLGLEAVGGPGRGENDDELEGAEGNVEEDGGVGGEADESLKNERTEDVADRGSDIDAERHGEEKPGLGLDEELDNLLPLELGVDDSGVVGAKTLDSLLAVLLIEEASGHDRVVEAEEEDRGSEDGDETENEEDDLVRVENGGAGRKREVSFGARISIGESCRIKTLKLSRTHLMCPSPYEMAEPSIVATPLVPYQAATLNGCSLRLYQEMVIKLKRGRHAASKKPRRNLVATREP